MDDFLNHYMFPFTFPSMIRGQNTEDQFILDLRNTQSPYIGNGYIDLYFSGELIYGEHDCTLVADDLNFRTTCYDENQYFCDTASQLVVSESAASCIANNWARSNIGHVFLDSNTVADLWADA